MQQELQLKSDAYETIFKAPKRKEDLEKQVIKELF